VDFPKESIAEILLTLCLSDSAITQQQIFPSLGREKFVARLMFPGPSSTFSVTSAKINRVSF
jgi:hypothetical protein